MSFFKNIFRKTEDQIFNYTDFWEWFQTKEASFYNDLIQGADIETTLFDVISPKLNKIKSELFYLAGINEDKTIDLIFTPDGILENFIFVEELVRAAPKLANWKFTALKPEHDIKDVLIRMGELTFSADNLFFYANEHEHYPDEIDITVLYADFREANKSEIVNGVYIFLDNYLGEINAVTSIDNLTVISKNDAKKDLVPISKLKDFLIWREKEFVEKYNGIRHDTEHDSYSSLEAELTNGSPLVAIVNSTLLDWDSKASHPWILVVEIKYDGRKNNGMPDQKTYQLMNQLEDELMGVLRDSDGYLNVGRQTVDQVREIYFACKEFRKSSKIVFETTQKYKGKLDASYTIYKDKYWLSLDKFRGE